ncbi:hypothetical protein D3C73_883090 [compost metagenome]
MVTVIGTPSEGKLRQIAGADHNAAILVGQIHQDLRSFPGLNVLIGQIVNILVMADILEMLQAGGLDVHYLERSAECLDQADGVVVGTVRCAETRHGDRQHIAGRAAEQLHRPHGDEQRQRGIQTAGDADYRLLSADVADALHQAGGLDGENLPAAVVPLLRIAGNERVHGEAADQLPSFKQGARCRIEHLTVVAAALAGPEGAHHCAGILDSWHIDVGDDDAALMGEALGFREHLSVLGDQRVAAEYDIRCRFAGIAAGVDITCHAGGGLAGDQLAAVIRFAHQLIAGRGIEQQCSSGLGEQAARRNRNPEILADFHAEGDSAAAFTGEDQIIADWHSRFTNPQF